jgi:hypothetical protein
MGLDILYGIITTFNKMKITILGRGNAGCISAIHFHHWGQFLKDKIEVDLIHDSKINPVPVGQATTTGIPDLLWQAIGNFQNSNFSHTLKNGIMYENWGNKNKYHFHEFPFGSYGIHFNPNEFQDFIVNNLKINFKEKDENIIDYKDIDSDYIIDCRGTPKDLKNYHKLINPLNHVLLASLPIEKEDVLWTRTIATPDGWCFYIPLKDRVSVGYNFNTEITSIKEAEINFKNIFKVKKINQNFKYNQYMAKEPVIDNRVILNGNKLFFLEPLEATAMHSYHTWCKFIWDSIIDKKYSLADASYRIKDYLFQIQNFILLHYGSGSIYKTKFWKFSKNLYNSNKDKTLENLIKEVDKHSMAYLKSNSNSFAYGMWNGWSIKNWIEGVK